MTSKYFISNYCQIAQGSIWVNGEERFSSPNSPFNDFIKAAYKHFDGQYPKFFKMDALSKLAFMGASQLVEQEASNTALLFGNQSASLDTDLNYQASIQDPEAYYPSPAVFVYTLPNIALGEICIKFKLYTENSFFVFEKFNVDFFQRYTEIILSTKKADTVLCGWVELLQENYCAYFYTVSKSGQWPHTVSSIKELFRLENE